ncbi:hypothetical protein I204_00225 [Kwoniella mangroviensis CBS 8886]|uniref:uncharacterized protein n=1 Tax=Kwoniella mangroviensis CBS 8507 TaxID=1296122 RepID=UPI00080D291C|nr:uncharacterized protein I203_02600 [Kwoniella mangroviensis CBS 8507]OCF67942.1 hypothetical protein I203_02600 [Kwoniella mangroviensis CBS 8507]OCF78287.1 hypothetical protein I204_00225 [Kwoniella mangroviensis CBS 8886]
MTTHLTSHSNTNTNQNDLPHTPHQEPQTQLFDEIPSSPPKMMDNQPNGNGLSMGSPTQNKNKNDQTLNKAKRRYSISLFKWTQELWENTRKDIERRSSTSSSESTDSISNNQNEKTDLSSHQVNVSAIH